jgi:N-acetylmuramoyl-L-alanine amidase
MSKKSKSAPEAKRAPKRHSERAPQTELSVPVPSHVTRGFTMLLLIIAAAGIGYAVLRTSGKWAGAENSPAAAGPGVQAAAVPVVPLAVAPPTVAADAPAGAEGGDDNRVGIVSGHKDNDSGTVCKDGLTENEVNFDHATRVAQILRAEGYIVDILGEKDARLQNYRARAFLSIHADSCAYINDLATGYKVARSRHSALPEAEDLLVACVSARYRKATGLRFHRNTVTANMLEYHSFYKIHALTPAAIIETGFMNLDRAVLTKRADDVARGIADGMLCFLRRETP